MQKIKNLPAGTLIKGADDVKGFVLGFTAGRGQTLRWVGDGYDTHTVYAATVVPAPGRVYTPAMMTALVRSMHGEHAETLYRASGPAHGSEDDSRRRWAQSEWHHNQAETYLHPEDNTTPRTIRPVKDS